MEWLNLLKIAIINESINDIIRLYDDMPDFDSLENKREAVALIEQALGVLHDEKKKTTEVLKRIETIKKYGNGTIGHPTIDKLSKAIY